jgi:hypothetical protein
MLRPGRAKSKTPTRKESVPPEGSKPIEAVRPIATVRQEPPKIASLFDAPPAVAPANAPIVSPIVEEEEYDIVQIDEDSQPEEDEGFDEVA